MGRCGLHNVRTHLLLLVSLSSACSLTSPPLSSRSQFIRYALHHTVQSRPPGKATIDHKCRQKRCPEPMLSGAQQLWCDTALPPATMGALHEAGLTRPTQIQKAAMASIRKGEHAVINSPTGSGKTLAYLLPLLPRLHVSRPMQLLIVVPSRELAVQTAAAVERYWPHHGTQRAFLLTSADMPSEELEEAVIKAACPVLVATPRPLLRFVRALAGTDRLYSRRALRGAGGTLQLLASRLRAVVIDEADSLLLSRHIAVEGPPPRKAYATLVGKRGVASNAAITTPETFTLPTPRALQALLAMREISVPTARGRGRRSGHGGRGGGRGKRGTDAASRLQVVACSASASYRFTAELARLLGMPKPEALKVVTESEGAARKRQAGERGRGGVSVPPTITHTWVGCNSASKPLAVAAVLRSLRPCTSLLFLADDAPLAATVDALCRAGIDAQPLHEVLKLNAAAPTAAYEGLVRQLQRSTEADTGTAKRAVRDTAAHALARSEADSQVRSEPPGGTEVAAAQASVQGQGPPRADEGAAPRVLVSTVGSARGLDLGVVDCVLLWSLPGSADAYMHLAGRTGRCGRPGRVVSILASEERGMLGTITRQLAISIKPDTNIALELSRMTSTDEERGKTEQEAEHA
mmetsp:Transcript_26758/g.51954  ORF Transcript_26758/g.51954 Transcript_26758/m.51954 type:complete len:637 (-) Transcript_26758:424-2334(-)